MSQESVVKQLLAEGTEDHLGLWWIIGAVEDNAEEPTPEELLQMTLAVIRELLESHEFRAGFPGKDGRSFQSWPGTTDEILGRIEREWRELDRPPTLGDVVWLASP